MGPSHIVYVNKSDNSETYLKNFADYEDMCAKDKKETGEENKRKSTKITYEWYTSFILCLRRLNPHTCIWITFSYSLVVRLFLLTL